MDGIDCFYCWYRSLISDIWMDNVIGIALIGLDSFAVFGRMGIVCTCVIGLDWNCSVRMIGREDIGKMD